MRRTVLTLVTVGALVGVALSRLSIAIRFALRVVSPPGSRIYDVRVVDYQPEQKLVVLPKTSDTRQPGEYLLVTENYRSWLVCGDIVTTTSTTVARRVIESSSLLAPGTLMRFTGWRWLTPGAAQLNAQSVEIPTALGRAPAWRILTAPDRVAGSAEPVATAQSQIWAIHIHGRASQRQEALRGVVSAKGVIHHHLVVSYRNDGVAPQSHWGRYALGAVEWRDVEHALHYALQQGATSIVLYGWSMGGTIALQCAAHSQYRDRIAAIVLDSPALDWVNILSFHARLVRVPSWAARDAQWLLERGIVRVDERQSLLFASLSASHLLRAVRVPILIMHSARDGYVPIKPARQLAKRFPDSVHLDEWSTGRHCKLWNVDPQRYESTVRGWLTSQLASAP